MSFEEMLEHLSLEYHAVLAATCLNSWGLVIKSAAEKFPTFYEFLLQRGYNRFQLSAHGISKNIEA